LPRSVTVAQVILDHFVMVRIHARQPFLFQWLTKIWYLPKKFEWTLRGRFTPKVSPSPVLAF